MPPSPLALGIDLGGTKITAAVLAADGRECWRRRAATPQGDYPATVAAVAGLVHAAERELAGPVTVGIGHPGAERADGRIKNANSTCLIGHPLRADLQAALARPVRLANDADCFALSEARDGAAADAACVFGVILGTGVGGGLVLDGRLLGGPNRIAGEWGHNPLPDVAADDSPPPCYCGRRGCVETWLSGPALAADHARHGGPVLDARAIAALADAGDAAAEASLRRYERRLARALATVINIVDPDAVVLGGGLSQLPRLYANVPQLWQEFIFTDETIRTRLLPPVFGDDSGVRGAAWIGQIG